MFGVPCVTRDPLLTRAAYYKIPPDNTIITIIITIQLFFRIFPAALVKKHACPPPKYRYARKEKKTKRKLRHYVILFGILEYTIYVVFISRDPSGYYKYYKIIHVFKFVFAFYTVVMAYIYFVLCILSFWNVCIWLCTNRWPDTLFSFCSPYSQDRKPKYRDKERTSTSVMTCIIHEQNKSNNNDFERILPIF